MTMGFRRRWRGAFQPFVAHPTSRISLPISLHVPTPCHHPRAAATSSTGAAPSGASSCAPTESPTTPSSTAWPSPPRRPTSASSASIVALAIVSCRRRFPGWSGTRRAPGARAGRRPPRCRWRRVHGAGHGAREQIAVLGAWMTERTRSCGRSEHEASGAHARYPGERRCRTWDAVTVALAAALRATTLHDGAGARAVAT